MCKGKLVYLMFNGSAPLVSLPSAIESDLVKAGYQSRKVLSSAELKNSCKKEVAEVIIVGAGVNSVDDNDFSEIFAGLRCKDGSRPLIIFISENESIEFRLEMVRRGVHSFFCQPQDSHKLTSMLAEYLPDGTAEVPVAGDTNNGTRTDITDLSLSEELLARSQYLARMGSWDWDIVTGELHWAGCIWQLFGYDKEVTETSHENFLAAVHIDDRKRLEDGISHCVENGAAYDIEYRVVWPDGSVRWLHETGGVIRGEDGTALHMLGVVQDVSDRVNAEELQREHEEKYRLQFEYSEEPMWLIADNQFVISNRAAVKTLGYDSLEELINTHPSALSPKYQPDGQPSFEKANQMMAIAYDAGYHRFEWNHTKKNGEEFPVDVSLTRIPFEGEQALFCVWRDISERKKIERDLIAAREEADRANKAKSTFLSRMSHELRTPLNSILGFAQLIDMDKESPLSESQQESVSEILKGGNHLKSLISDVLDIAKIEAGHIDVCMENVVISKEISESIRLIAMLADQRGISVKRYWNREEITKEDFLRLTYTIYCDKLKLKQVMLNLLSNAVKYNEDNGEIIIACEVMSNRFRISVTDTGGGLDEEHQERLFIPFERLGANQTDVEGVGIGLVITKNLAELMGGDVGVNSVIGEGSTFWIDLPNDDPGVPD